jgi:hypothetical protein
VLDFLLFAKTRRFERQETQVLTKPIWQIAKELVQDIPLDVIETMPVNGASEHDHYLYGTPEQNQ